MIIFFGERVEKNLKNEKKIIILVCIVAFFISCSEKPSPRVVKIFVSFAETNYHPCDSLQRLGGFYPARVYLSLGAYNMSDETLFLPVQKRFDTLMKSSIEFVGNMSSRAFLRESDAILPKDTIGIILVVNLDNIPDSDIFSVLHNFIRDINMAYHPVKSDTLLSKYSMPDTVIFSIDRNIQMKFTDLETINSAEDWVL